MDLEETLDFCQVTLMVLVVLIETPPRDKEKQCIKQSFFS